MTRDPIRPEIEAAAVFAEDVRSDARSWVSSGASIYGIWLSDSVTDTVGLREYEGGISVPLRLPREHRARSAEAAAASRAAGVGARLRQLEVAGAVREAYWDLETVRGRMAVAEHEVEHLQELDDLVAARVARADAAPLERDLSSAQVSEAKQLLALVRGEVEAAGHAWRQLTGCAEAPVDAVEATPEAAAATPTGHPRLQLADALRDAAAARLDAARAQPGQAPTLGVIMRRERGAAFTPWIDSLGLTVTVPVGRSGQRIRARGEAAQALAGSDAQRLSVRRSLALAQDAARERLGAAMAAADSASERLAHVERALLRARDAYEAGEWDTVELLRIEGLAAEARLADREARAAAGRAAARLNQAFGRLP